MVIAHLRFPVWMHSPDLSWCFVRVRLYALGWYHWPAEMRGRAARIRKILNPVICQAKTKTRWPFDPGRGWEGPPSVAVVDRQILT